MWAVAAVAGASLLAWIVLILGRGGFWRARPRLPECRKRRPQRATLPSVWAIVPARNEEHVLPRTLPTVLRQSYRGAFHAVVVDDRSEDATQDVALQAAESSGSRERLTVRTGEPLPPRWAGKVWAMHQGIALAEADGAEYLWFTDADIEHDPDVLESLVTQAENDELDLVSVMARLRIESRVDRLLIPAFVYFFAKLYPFRWVNDPRRCTAGAAGGCVLVRARSLRDVGGLASIRSALIDDCALGRLIKAHRGRIWLGFSPGVRSVRAYGTLRSVWDMVARSAFHQLHYSWLLLGGTVLGMLLLYAAPPSAAIVGLAGCAAGTALGGPVAALGATAWLMMAASFFPQLRYQGSSWWIAPLLPVAGVLYTAMTVSSAYRHATGRGGLWKGRPHVAGRSEG
jgi:hopene-associated glycosyltransferase HpnB